MLCRQRAAYLLPVIRFPDMVESKAIMVQLCGIIAAHKPNECRLYKNVHKMVLALVLYVKE